MPKPDKPPMGDSPSAPEIMPAADRVAHGALPTDTLVHIAFVLQEERAKLDVQIAEVEAALIAKGAGKHSSADGRTVTVIAVVPGNAGKLSYALADDKLDAARELADAEFGNLFDRQVSYTPCEGFENVAPKLLTPAKARDLIALCAVQGKPYTGRAASVRYK